MIATLPAADARLTAWRNRHRRRQVNPDHLRRGIDPEQLDVSADGTRMFVANEDTSQVSRRRSRVRVHHRHRAVGSEPEGRHNTARWKNRGRHQPRRWRRRRHRHDNLSGVERRAGRPPAASIAFLPDRSRRSILARRRRRLAVIDSNSTKDRPRPAQRSGRRLPAAPMGLAMAKDGSSPTPPPDCRRLFVDPHTIHRPASWSAIGRGASARRPTAHAVHRERSIERCCRRRTPPAQLAKEIKVGIRPWVSSWSARRPVQSRRSS